jgi:two-component system, NtrC family, sensor kinase
MRLARKLIVAIVVGILLVVVAYDAFVVRANLRDYEARINEDVATLGYGVAVMLPRLVRDSGPDAAEAMIAERNAGYPTRIRWVALDVPPDDVRAFELAPEQIAELRRGGPVKVIRPSGSSERLFIYRPFLGETPVHDIVEASESLAPLRERLAQQIAGVVVESIVIILLAVASAFVLGIRFVARPVQELVDQARRIGAGDLSKRLDLLGHEELSELASEMNVMCDRLTEARSRLAEESAAKIAAVEQLRHADRLATVGQLASGVAHELGTPLNVVAGHAKMIASGDMAREEDRDGARVIAEQAERMTAIIRQLLHFARRGEARLEDKDIRPVVERTIHMIAPLALKKGIEMRFTEGGRTRARMDESRIEQVITNLVVNACQAMPTGGRIDFDAQTVRASRPGTADGERAYVRLSVADHGTGIRAEDLPRIFEPFYTTKDVGVGTGLGLSVCHGIVEEHGGWISVESTLGKGSCFMVYLPAGDEMP